MAAPPKRAAAPTAPVFMGTPRPLLVDDAWVATGAVDDGVATPEVKGTPPDVAVDAPLKAGTCEEADVSGLAVLLVGLRTLRRVQVCQLLQRDKQGYPWAIKRHRLTCQ